MTERRPALPSTVLSRRGFLGASAAAGLLVAAPRWVRGPLLVGSGDAPPLAGPPFTLGVASGDPLPDAVVLWTRLAPDPQAPDWGMPAQPVPVRWEIARDERFRRIERTGTATAVPDTAHSVHVDAKGLEPVAKVDNPVVLSGDIHCAWVNNVLPDFADERGTPVGTEIVGTSITSSFPLSDVVKGAVANQPHIKYFEGASRGYVRCELDKTEWRADHRYVSTIVANDATVETGASFVIEAGNPGAQAA